jgi:chromosome segregation ATPase
MAATKASRLHRNAFSLSLVTAAGFATLAVAQTGGNVQTVIQEQVKTEQAAMASQAKIDQLDDESSRMLAEYRQITAEAQSLKSYNDQLAVQVKSQSDDLQQMSRQIEEIATTSREVLPMMNKMMTTLEKFVQLDIPFLQEERATRVAGLKDMMTRADVSISEKYRRIIEAYQIEIEYGRTLEAYQGKIDDRMVEFLRTGRISLMYQTLDGQETGHWDNTARAWKVDDKYAEDVQEALKVAKKQAAPDFVGVAVAAPVEAGS